MFTQVDVYILCICVRIHTIFPYNVDINPPEKCLQSVLMSTTIFSSTAIHG